MNQDHELLLMNLCFQREQGKDLLNKYLIYKGK